MPTDDENKQENPLLRLLREHLSLDDKKVPGDLLRDIIDILQGNHLSSIIKKEWELARIKEVLDAWEIEHSKSLALLFENEIQKIQLEELNLRLSESVRINNRDMHMAEKVQRSLLYQTPPVTGNFDIAFHYEPYASVSGDFYDFYVSGSNQLEGMVIADVSGHGIASSLITALAKPVFFRYFRNHRETPLNTVMEKINVQLIQEMAGSEIFITAAFLRFTGNAVEYVNAAHPDIILRSWKKGECKPVRPEASPLQGRMLGISSLEMPARLYTFSLNRGDALIIFTDCLVEGRDGNGKEFGEKRVLEVMEGMCEAASARDILDQLLIQYKTHTDNLPLKDDLTVIVLKSI